MTQPLTPPDHLLLSQIAEDVRALRDDNKAIRERIYGNGKPGIISDMESIRHDVRSLIAGIAARDKLAYTIGGIVVSILIGFLWNIFTGQVDIIFK
jgi:hypothetical protein